MSAIGSAGTLLLVLSSLGFLGAIRWRTLFATALCTLLAAIALLLIALLTDRFELTYVANYSARDLPLWLKAATFWGGEEGGLLLLALINALIAWRYRHSNAHTCNTQLLLAATFCAAALVWSPFNSNDSIPTDGAGMNAHLLSVWMAIHPPAVFIAYALIWAPLGPALACLRGAPADNWRRMVEGPARLGWLLLSTGLASGMWWAFQDFTYGQVWHWDPVQTALLIVWLLSTAQMHGLRQTPYHSQAPRVLLAASVLSALAIPMALWIVRDDTLASSHRYVGDTSSPLMALLCLGIVSATVYSLLRSSAQRPPVRTRGHTQLLRFAVYLLLTCAFAAAAALLFSYGCAELQCERSFNPFRESLLTWASKSESLLVHAAFEQWEVDQFRLLPALLPLLALALLLTGHSFLRASLRWPWRSTLIFALLSAVAAFYWQPLQNNFSGTGVTTGRTVAVFQLLEVLLAWSLWPFIGAIVWSARAIKRQGWRAAQFAVPVAVIHLGAVCVLVGAIVAGSLDTIKQRSLQLPRDYNKLHSFSSGLQLSLAEPEWTDTKDGGKQHGDGFSAISTLNLQFSNQHWPFNSKTSGSTLYRDSRAQYALAPNNDSFRQRCLVLDHRFGRFLDRPGLMIDPVIHHALLSDTQVWLPAAPPPMHGESQESLLLVREFPLLSLLWSGWMMILLGATVLTLAPLMQRASRKSH